VDYEFTAEMEDELDAISRGEAGHIEYLRAFYFGNGGAGLKERLENKVEEIDARQVCTLPLERQPESDEEIVVRVGRYGPFLQQGESRAGIPDDLPPADLTLEVAMELIEHASRGDEPLGNDPESGEPVYVKVGRFGPYVQRGSKDDGKKPKNQSLLPGMRPEEVNLDVALKLLSLPRALGEDPKTGEIVEATHGRYGPYVKQGSETRSMPEGVSPLDITLQQALDLLAQPKRGRRRGTPKKPVREFEESPVTGNKIVLYEGRYGPYVTDGETNASIPKGTSIEDVSHEEAVHLLAEKAARGPRKKKRGTKRKTDTKEPE
jgi:DNA topoisomerase-1